MVTQQLRARQCSRVGLIVHLKHAELPLHEGGQSTGDGGWRGPRLPLVRHPPDSSTHH
jgi:hypothetical protein